MMKLKITNDAKLGIIISVVALSFVTYIYMTHADFTSSFKSLFGFDFATFQCQSTGHTNCLSNPNSQTCMSGYQNSGGVCVLIYNGACRTAGSTCTGSGSAQSSIVVAPKGTNAVCTTAQVAAGYIIVNGVCTQNYCPYGTTWDGKLCTSNTQPQYANNPTFTTPQFLSPSTPLTQQCPDGSIIPVTSTCPVVQNTQKCYDGSIIPVTSTCPVPNAPVNSKQCPDGSIIPVTSTCPVTSTQTFQSTTDTSTLQTQINTLQSQLQQQASQGQSSSQLSQLQSQISALQNQLIQQSSLKTSSSPVDLSFLSNNLPILIAFSVIALIVVVIVKVNGSNKK